MVDNHTGTCECALVSGTVVDGFGVRLKAGHQFLVLIIEVRILYPELLRLDLGLHAATQRFPFKGETGMALGLVAPKADGTNVVCLA